MPSSSGDGSGFRLADFALAIEGGALFHLETDSIHRAQDDGGGGEAARVKGTVADHFSLDDSLLRFEVSLDRGILSDRQTALGGDISGNGTVEDEIARTIEISLNLNVAG